MSAASSSRRRSAQAWSSRQADRHTLKNMLGMGASTADDAGAGAADAASDVTEAAEDSAGAVVDETKDVAGGGDDDSEE